MKTFRKTIEIGLGIVVVLLIMQLLNIGLSYFDGRQERLKKIEEIYKGLEEKKLKINAELEEIDSSLVEKELIIK